MKFNELYHFIFDHLIEEIFDIKRQLEDSGKLFLVNKTKQEFICSSTPINFSWKANNEAHYKILATTVDKKIIDIGDYLEFLTIHLPVSSNVSIFLFDKDFDSNLTNIDFGIGLIEDWNSDLILNLNYNTMLRNVHKIFSASGNY